VLVQPGKPSGDMGEALAPGFAWGGGPSWKRLPFWAWQGRFPRRVASIAATRIFNANGCANRHRLDVFIAGFVCMDSLDQDEDV
jgi:hypothetical protein